ncbi:MAG: N-acetylmuramoyl-L-alanine amidase [Spartobacteria bacterium]|nr:N-acetylmuramoyl-L-alanine amidase [Spartobacteria bacterium]
MHAKNENVNTQTQPIPGARARQHPPDQRLICALVLLFVILLPGIAPAAQREPRMTTWKGQSYVTLRDMGRFYNLKLSNPKKKIYALKSKWSRLGLEENSRKATLNDRLFWLHRPLEKVGRHWAIHKDDWQYVIDPLLRSSAYLADQDYKIVVLDPGHGGKDRGASGKHGTDEKFIVQELAREIRLQLVNAGVRNVYLTRDHDQYLELEERCRRAKKWKADVFVSIHMNSGANADTVGIETFTMTVPGQNSTHGSKPESTQHPGNRHDAASMILAAKLQDSMVDRLRTPDRGVKRARFAVLKNAPCPAALIECGFLSNPTTEQNFNKPAYRRMTAKAVADGILKYLDDIKRAKLEDAQVPR